MQVGQTIYGYGANNNRSRIDGTRRYMELPIGYEPYLITAETKQSWICGSIKIDKKTMLERNKNYTPIRFVETLEEVERKYFVVHNRLDEKIRCCRDYDKLKRIEAIFGGG